MYWTFTAGLCVTDVERVDTDKNGTGVDQVRGSLTADVRRASGVPRGAEVPIPTGVQEHGGASQLAVGEHRRWNPPLCRIRQSEEFQRQVNQRLQLQIGEIGAILTGYLGSAEQAEPIAALVRAVKAANPAARPAAANPQE